MKTNRIFLFLGISALAITAGCSATKKAKIDNSAQYWQRVAASESTYLNGPKAQQLLNRDIARCVTELRELERLGQVKNAIPMDRKNKILSPDDYNAKHKSTIERDGYLFGEHKNYSDFEGCMGEQGWERTRFITPRAESYAAKNYFANHVSSLETVTTATAADSDNSTVDTGPYNK